MDSTNPSQNSNFMGLLTSQHDPLLSDSNAYYPQAVELGSSQVPLYFSESPQDVLVSDPITGQCKQRKRWSPEDDKLLTSAWLNTSKDPVTANEQRMGGTFWERISNYIALHCKASSGLGPTEPTHCKQHWHKLNSEVNKLCGSYEAATRGKSSGQSEDDVLNVAHELFFSDYKSKFNLDHA
ncbi:unnamed protein product [Microthlaspi erraticum]|uniref:Myb-like domain-containing protein n=1 Tax=Microthlaspi erraticum TaxID=1685480 RepID=A0A6D2I5L6_9BRAS|nr:unnamed protein product [Microthlaspi erraticum]